jgi:MFS family permease
LVRIFVSLFFATATAQIGLGIISPILPLYARTFSASGLAIGLVFAAFSASRTLFGPILGRASDRVGRKSLIVAGLASYTAVSILYTLAGNLWQLGLFRFLQGIASVMVTPLAQAYVGDLTPRGKEGQYTNLFYSSQFMGMAIGPVLGGGIGAAWSYESAFYAMAALSMVSLLLVVFTVPADRRLPAVSRPSRMAPIRQVIAHDAVKAMMTYAATRGFWRQAFNTFYPLYAVAALSADEASIGLVLSVYMFTEGLLEIPFGFLADRYPRMRQIVVGSGCAPLALVAIPFVGSTWGVVLLAFAMGAFSALGRASLVAIRTALGRTYGMGTLAGLQGSAFAFGQMFGPVVSGAVVDGLGLAAAFPFGSGVGMIGTVLVIAWMRRWLRKNPGDAGGGSASPGGDPIQTELARSQGAGGRWRRVRAGPEHGVLPILCGVERLPAS